MSVFTDAELAFLSGHRHGRIATVNAGGDPHVVPVAFRYNPDADALEVGGPVIVMTKKYRDASATGRAAFVVDDGDPPHSPPRGVEVRGRVEALPEGGQEIFPMFMPEVLRIVPTHIASWGIETEIPTGRDVASA
ncbi:MAG: PPOX class F420-dependent oxidoreductase [Actinomycetota bacterium]